MSWLDTLDQIAVADAAEEMLASPAGREYIERVAGGDVRFGLWLRNVDVRLSRMIGLTHRDLADWNLRDAFDDGMTPRQGALETMRHDDTYAAMVGAF